jgi:hypothetical protein
LSPIEPSGYYYPNRLGRVTLNAIEEILGKNGIDALLRSAGLERRIDNYPASNLSREWDFAEFSALDAALDDMVGPRGGRALSFRVARTVFNQGLQSFAAFAEMADLAFRMLPQRTKMKVGLKAMAEVFTEFSDQPSHVEEAEGCYLFVIDRCPVCWGRKTDKPICHVAAGLIQAGATWISGGPTYRVREIECIAQGGNTCSFEVPQDPVNQRSERTSPFS